MPLMPNETTYKERLFAANAGKQVVRDYLQQTVPENTSVLVCGLIVNEGTEDAVLAAIAAIANVNVCREVGRQRTPNWTPPGQEWEIGITAIGRHRMLPEPE